MGYLKKLLGVVIILFGTLLGILIGLFLFKFGITELFTFVISDDILNLGRSTFGIIIILCSVVGIIPFYLSLCVYVLLNHKAELGVDIKKFRNV